MSGRDPESCDKMDVFDVLGMRTTSLLKQKQIISVLCGQQSFLSSTQLALFHFLQRQICEDFVTIFLVAYYFVSYTISMITER